jgi:hypothetical protein
LLSATKWLPVKSFSEITLNQNLALGISKLTGIVPVYFAARPKSPHVGGRTTILRSATSQGALMAH